jgi:AAA ATPase-like protein
VDEDGRVLVWIGALESAATPGSGPVPAAAPAGGQARPPRAYTPKHLGEKILTTRSALEGERKQVTVLFVDISDSLVEAYIRSEALGPVEAKGQREPVVAYRVTGRRRWRSRLEISAALGLTPFAGRQRELALLHDCLARAKAGRGQVVGIVGEAVVGKSRLLYEFHAALERGRVTWPEGHCVAHAQTTPYGPILEILRMNFQIDDGDHPLQIQEKLRQGIHLLDPSLEETLPFLEALFGLPGADEALRHLDPKERRQQTFEAIRALALAGSQRRPHVLVCENWSVASSCAAMVTCSGWRPPRSHSPTPSRTSCGRASIA